MPLPRYQEIFNEFKAKILRGEYGPGTKLPGVVSLSQQYGVSRITSNRVLQELENAGLAERRERVGTFVLNKPTSLRDLFVLASPDYQRMAHLFEYWRGIVDRAGAAGVSTHLVQVTDPNIETAVRPDQFVGQGVIFLEEQPTTISASLKRNGIPYLYLGVRPNTRDYFVNEDLTGAAKELVGRMLRDGYRRIGFLANLAAPNHREARSGYLEAVAETGIGHDLVRDVDDSTAAEIVRRIAGPPYHADAVVIVGSHLPFAALPAIVSTQNPVMPGFLFGTRQTLSLSSYGYVAFLDHHATGSLAVDVLRRLVSDPTSPPRGSYTGYTILTPGAHTIGGDLPPSG